MSHNAWQHTKKGELRWIIANFLTWATDRWNVVFLKTLVFSFPNPGRQKPLLSQCPVHTPVQGLRTMAGTDLAATGSLSLSHRWVLPAPPSVKIYEICRNVHISKAFNFCMWFDSMSGEGKAGSHKCINSGNQHKHILPSFHWVAAFYSPMSHTLLRELRRCRNIQYLIIREAVESTERPTQGTLFMKQFKSKVIYTTLRIAFEACFQFQFYPTSISYLP